ncbi:MAG: DNA primase large subunit PriL [Candidatus Bathyarchaeia archaeon]
MRKPEYEEILKRAEDRVKAALLGKIEYEWHFKEEVEVVSFPVSIIMVSAMKNDLIKRRFAEHESKKVAFWLKSERCEEIVKIAKIFNWRIRHVRGSDFALHFVDYLKNSVIFNEPKWKIVNRMLLNGEVLLSINDVVRLLEEEVRRYIENKLSVGVDVELPENLIERVEELKKTASKEIKELKPEEFPKDVNRDAFPPCIRSLYESTIKGLRVSHIGRFTLTSFLLNIGLNLEEIINLFGSSSDFNERMTRYQVEHISGCRGSKTKYIPPKCSTLQTHRLCVGKDDLCNKVSHPINYYRRKYRLLMKNKTP